jgi:hypothetical protein
MLEVAAGMGEAVREVAVGVTVKAVGEVGTAKAA